MTVSSTVPATSQRAALRRIRALRQVLSLNDFERIARRRLPRPIYGFVSGGTEDGVSLANNRDAFRHWGFIPNVLQDTSRRTQSVTLFKETYASPFGIAPMGAAALVAYRGDHALAEAARAAKIPMIISGSGLTRLEDVAEVYPHAWFQAYVPGEPQRIDALLGRVEASGLRTLVVTVDTTVAANRENNIRNGYSTPLRPSARLFWDGAICPRWAFGTFIATLGSPWHAAFRELLCDARRADPVTLRRTGSGRPRSSQLDASRTDAAPLERQFDRKGHSFRKGRGESGEHGGGRNHSLQSRRPSARRGCCAPRCAASGARCRAGHYRHDGRRHSTRYGRSEGLCPRRGVYLSSADPSSMPPRSAASPACGMRLKFSPARSSAISAFSA